MTASYAHPESLVSTDWLAPKLHQPDLRIIDGTYYLPMQGKDAKAEYLDEMARHWSAQGVRLTDPEDLKWSAS